MKIIVLILNLLVIGSIGTTIMLIGVILIPEIESGIEAIKRFVKRK